MKKVINQKIPLKVFHCRKNRIDGELIPKGLFKKLNIHTYNFQSQADMIANPLENFLTSLDTLL